ncbi:MAG: hypothetical protein K9H49_14840 [Bacteroidales bacterium]|nr:hypothetical protein [Bacteroidales bacterium]MCF8390634.1 hypothetical protein [Bacteroidales bacterium]
MPTIYSFIALSSVLIAEKEEIVSVTLVFGMMIVFLLDWRLLRSPSCLGMIMIFLLEGRLLRSPRA